MIMMEGCRRLLRTLGQIACPVEAIPQSSGLGGGISISADLLGRRCAHCAHLCLCSLVPQNYNLPSCKRKYTHVSVRAANK